MRNATHTSRRAATVLLAALTLGTALDGPLLGAGEIRMAIDGGRVTLSATEAPLADVLAEWSRVGGTRFVGAETLSRETVTLRLVDADEADAIRLLLRAAAGYVAAPRRTGVAGAARYDRVTILAARRTPAPRGPRSGGTCERDRRRRHAGRPRRRARPPADGGAATGARRRRRGRWPACACRCADGWARPRARDPGARHRRSRGTPDRGPGAGGSIAMAPPAVHGRRRADHGRPPGAPTGLDGSAVVAGRRAPGRLRGGDTLLVGRMTAC